MKKIIAFVAVVIIGTAIADSVATQAEILDALTKLYHRDMKSSSGRTKWHGKATKLLDAQEGVQIETYEDGLVYTNDLKKTAQQKVYDANLRLKSFTDAKGFPKKLAEARKANAFAKTNTVEVSVNITAGK